MENDAFNCKNGHHLGIIVRNGNKVPQLMIYREAMPADGNALPTPLMIGPVIGQMTVPCTLCDDKRTWSVNVKVMLYLVETMPIKMLFEFWLELLQRAKIKELEEMKNETEK